MIKKILIASKKWILGKHESQKRIVQKRMIQSSDHHCEERIRLLRAGNIKAQHDFTRESCQKGLWHDYVKKKVVKTGRQSLIYNS